MFTIRVGTPTDIAQLLPLMRGYYRDDGLQFDELHSRAVILRLLSEPQWGCVLLVERASQAVGYIALCLGFSLEMGGNDAFVDELFVADEYRGQGLAKRLLDALEAEARRRGVKALHLEVDKTNTAVHHLYLARRYKMRDRYHLMTKPLSE